MAKLIIVESPAKAKTIEKYLGKNYRVVSSKGHIRDLSKTGKGRLGIDVENNFEPHYVVSKDKKDVVKQLKTNAKNVSEVYIASDPDREGEAIAWHILDELNLDIKQLNRVVFNEITSKAVKKAIENPRQIDMDLVRSQETRRMLDRIIGFKLSNLLRQKIKSQSAGRVQSVALSLIVKREEEIQQFIPQEYWNLEIDVNGLFKAKLTKYKNKKVKIESLTEAESIINHLSENYYVTTIEHKVKNKESKLPFITSTLQQEAATKLNFSAKKTMQVAQKLYEGIQLKNGIEGLITYMRTDSYRLSDDFVKETLYYIENTYGEQYVGKYRPIKQGNAQDAHEAIRVSNIQYTPSSIKSYLSHDEYKLYQLIYFRTIASLMASAKLNATTISIINNEAEFTANGQTLVFDGYLKVYSDYESTSETLLPELVENQLLEHVVCEKSQHFTEPPLRYSEARLIKELEENGVGRPSTYATILSTLQDRKYVLLEKATASSKTKVFFPTRQGILTNTQLLQFFSEIINVEYTALLEKQLDIIAEGDLSHVEALNNFYQKFIPLVDIAYEKMEKKQLERVNALCPKCSNELVYREGKYGKFISCSTYPECDYTQNEQDDRVIDEKCPDCGGALTYKKGRFGEFVGCSNYPTCKYIKSSKEKKEPEKTGKICPECEKELVIRVSRYNKPFLACSGFPKCRYIAKLEE